MRRGTLCVCGGYMHPHIEVHQRSCATLNNYTTVYDKFSRGDLRHMVDAGLRVFDVCLFLEDAGMRDRIHNVGALTKAGPRMIDPLLFAAGFSDTMTLRKLPSVLLQLISGVLASEELQTELEALADSYPAGKVYDRKQHSRWHFDRVDAVLNSRGLVEYARLLSSARAYARGRFPQLFDEKEER